LRHSQTARTTNQYYKKKTTTTTTTTTTTKNETRQQKPKNKWEIREKARENNGKATQNGTYMHTYYIHRQMKTLANVRQTV